MDLASICMRSSDIIDFSIHPGASQEQPLQRVQLRNCIAGVTAMVPSNTDLIICVTQSLQMSHVIDVFDRATTQQCDYEVLMTGDDVPKSLIYGLHMCTATGGCHRFPHTGCHTLTTLWGGNRLTAWSRITSTTCTTRSLRASPTFLTRPGPMYEDSSSVSHRGLWSQILVCHSVEISLNFRIILSIYASSLDFALILIFYYKSLNLIII